MGKNVHNDVLDEALGYIKSNATRLVVLTSEPVGASAYSNAQKDKDSSGFRLAEKTITSANYTGPGEGSPNGRELQVSVATSMSVNGVASSANASHVGLVQWHSSSASLQNVLYVTSCTQQNLTGGNKVNTPAWTITLRDPT
jgi:hypothetical protein